MYFILPFHVSFYRHYQTRRIKECIGIKDCEAQFIQIRIVRLEEDLRRRSQINNGGNGMTPSAAVTFQLGTIEFQKIIQWYLVTFALN